MQLQWRIQVFKINLKPERGSAGCRLRNSALNTNTDCFGRRPCVAIPYVPAEYAVTYLLYFSSSRRQAPPVLIHSPPPILLLGMTSNNMAPFCHCVWKRADGKKSRNLQSVRSHPWVTLTSFPHTQSPSGGKRKGELCTSYSVTCRVDARVHVL